MTEFNGMLIVRHTQAVHRKIEDVLKKLRQAQRGKQEVSDADAKDEPPLIIPPGKRLVTLNGNGWQVPLNAIHPGSRVDVVRFWDDGTHEVVLSNAAILLPNIARLTMAGFSTPSTLLVNSISLIVTPEEGANLIKTENVTPIPLKFFLRSNGEEDNDEDKTIEDRADADQVRDEEGEDDTAP